MANQNVTTVATFMDLLRSNTATIANVTMNTTATSTIHGTPANPEGVIMSIDMITPVVKQRHTPR